MKRPGVSDSRSLKKREQVLASSSFSCYNAVRCDCSGSCAGCGIGIGSGIEVVITGLTRNQVVLTGSWVRIPPAPPSKNPVTMRVSGFFFFCTRFKNHPILGCSFHNFGKNSFLLYSTFFLRFAPICCRNRPLREAAYRTPSPAPRTVSNCNPDGRKCLPWWKNPNVPASPEFA